MNDWAERAAQRIEDAYNNGQLSDDEYRAEMRYLRDDVLQAAHDAAEQAYDDALGGW